MHLIAVAVFNRAVPALDTRHFGWHQPEIHDAMKYRSGRYFGYTKLSSAKLFCFTKASIQYAKGHRERLSVRMKSSDVAFGFRHLCELPEHPYKRSHQRRVNKGKPLVGSCTPLQVLWQETTLALCKIAKYRLRLLQREVAILQHRYAAHGIHTTKRIGVHNAEFSPCIDPFRGEVQFNQRPKNLLDVD